MAHEDDGPPLAVFPLLLGCGDKGGDSGAEGDTDTDVAEWTDLLGRTYVQEGHGVGYASYHFVAEDDVLIDYTAAPPSWQTDAGLPMPAQKGLITLDFDGTTRTFTGKADWSVPEDTTIEGALTWSYTMVFAADFSAVTGGQVEWLDPAGTLLTSFTFADDLHYVLYTE